MTDASTLKIALSDDLTSPPLQRLIDLLEVQNGSSHDTLRFVGGCVRDHVLDRPFRDIDLATVLEPLTVIQRVEAAGLKAIPTGLDHGTVTVVSGGVVVEVTTLRRDVATDGRRATVAFTTDWREDARRRDFTMNALSMDRKGRVYDYFGGVADAKAGLVRFVGDAEQRIHEDALRILRFFRFHAHYGGGAIDSDALEACSLNAALIATLSAERIRIEMLKLLSTPAPAPVIRLMQKAGVWSALSLGEPQLDLLFALDGLDRPDGFDGLNALGADRLAVGADDALLRLAALVPLEISTQEFGERVRLSNAEIKRITVWRRLVSEGLVSESAVNAALYQHGSDNVLGAVRLALARGDRVWDQAHHVAQNWVPKRLPIRGRDLDLPPGPALGEILKKVEAWWIEARFAPDRSACLEKARQFIAARESR